MSPAQKRGALLFFGKASCVQCHAVAGRSNEVFSDFQMHVAGIPQIAPRFGAGLAMFLSEMLGAIFRKMAIRTLVSSILRKRTKIFTSSGHHLSGIWLFSLRSFTAAHLPVCRKRCVIIWMRSNSDRNMTQFEQEWRPTSRTTRAQLLRSCDASIPLYRNYPLFPTRNFLIFSFPT